MHIQKVSNSYDDYKLDVSWPELKALEAALAQNHAGVVADETFARMQFYMARLPGPGEEKEKGSDQTLEQTRAKEELGAMGKGAGQLTPDDIPMPPGASAGENHPLPGGEGGGEKPPTPPVTPKPEGEKPLKKEKPAGEIELEDIPFPKARRVI